MGTICIYAIKSAICLAIMYIPYMLLLRNETFYRFNRIVLVSILLLSLALPMFNISPLAFLDNTEMGEANRAITEVGIPMIEIGTLRAELDYDGQQTLTNAPAQDKSVGWAEIVVALYIAGLSVTLIIKLVQLLKMLSFMRKGCLWTSEEDGVKTYCHIRNLAPFSWMNNIVISEHDYNEGGREILMHEQAHIRCGHSYDVCLVAVCEVVQWFNPFIWLLSSSLADVHEYEADAEVLSKGVDASSYQMLLIKKAVGTSSYAFANSFNHSLLKKRITMMLKKKSSPWMRTKALYVIPMAGIALSAFATSEFTNSAELISESKVSNLTANEQMPEQVAAMTNETTSVAEQAAIVAQSVEEVQPVVEKEAAEKDVLAKELDTMKSQAEKNADATASAIVPEDSSEVLMACEQMPEFPGGQPEMMKFIAKNIRYPQLAHKYGVKGRVLVQFVVEKDGSISETKIIHSKIAHSVSRTDSLSANAETVFDEVVVNAEQMEDSGDPNTLSMKELIDLIDRMPGAEMDEEGNVTINGKSVKTLKVVGKEKKIDQEMVAYQNARIALENEAAKVIKAMPKWTPGMHKGEAVRVRYTIPITYRLQ